MTCVNDDVWRSSKSRLSLLPDIMPLAIIEDMKKLLFFILSLSTATFWLTVAFAQDASPQLPSAPSATSRSSPAPAPAASQTEVSTPAPTVKTAPTVSQDAPPAQPAQDDSISTIRKTVNEVNVVFTVTDKHGRYIKDLKKEDFKVVDDGRPAAEIRSFSRQTDLPLEVGLLVDASNSVRDRFKFEQQSAIEFLNQTVRPKYDKAFVVGFDSTPEVTQDFTDDTDALSKGVRALRPGGGTALYDAVYFASRDKLAKGQQQGVAVRKAIILLTDGDDNQSHVTRDECIEMAQRAEVVIYTISTNVTGSKSQGDKVLQLIADSTGGRAFFPFQITDVANAFGEIQDELRSQYAISYKPAEFASNGRFHSIEILAQNRKGFRVRSRHGYYAPTQ